MRLHTPVVAELVACDDGLPERACACLVWRETPLLPTAFGSSCGWALALYKPNVTGLELGDRVVATRSAGGTFSDQAGNQLRDVTHYLVLPQPPHVFPTDAQIAARKAAGWT